MNNNDPIREQSKCNNTNIINKKVQYLLYLSRSYISTVKSKKATFQYRNEINTIKENLGKPKNKERRIKT